MGTINSPDEPGCRTAARVRKVSRTSPRNACVSPTRPWCRPGPERNPAASLAVVGPGGCRPGALGSSGLYGQHIRTTPACQEGNALFFKINILPLPVDSIASAARATSSHRGVSMRQDGEDRGAGNNQRRSGRSIPTWLDRRCGDTIIIEGRVLIPLARNLASCEWLTRRIHQQ